MFVGTLNLLWGTREIKTSNKPKKGIAEGSRFRVTTPSFTCEPVPEVETDVADSGAQLGSVSNSWLVMLPMVNYVAFFFKVNESGPGPLSF